MSEMFIMRRANGDLFTEELNGRMRVPVWSSEEALARYKERNPELMIFFPTRLTGFLIDKIRGGLGSEGGAEFFLLDEDDPDANLDDGKPIPLEEIFSGGDSTPQPAQPQL